MKWMTAGFCSAALTSGSWYRERQVSVSLPLEDFNRTRVSHTLRFTHKQLLLSSIALNGRTDQLSTPQHTDSTVTRCEKSKCLLPWERPITSSDCVQRSCGFMCFYDAVLTCAVGLIRPVSAVVVSVAAPRLADTNASSTCELSWATLVRLWGTHQQHS